MRFTFVAAIIALVGAVAAAPSGVEVKRLDCYDQLLLVPVTAPSIVERCAIRERGNSIWNQDVEESSDICLDVDGSVE
ncbi:hypothetical protein FRC12_000361 [Ceratobasidium sp. 428]|nr:hypothetical protein FRC12_000361 [Ceratobasidium sp. 428]